MQTTVALADHELNDVPFPTVIFRHSGWANHRTRVFESLHRTHQSFSRRAAFKHCGSHAYVLRSVEHPDTYRIAGSSCHDRFCLPCANERSRRVAANVLELVAEKTLRFVTLTLKSDQESLATLLQKLYISFAKLRRRVAWRKRVTGGLAFLEVKRSENANRWHPHLHVLVTGSYLPMQMLRKLWYEITTDSYIVDIRLVRDRHKACAYITKYAAKPFNRELLKNDHFLDEAVRSLAHRRLVIAFGNLKSVTLTVPPEASAWEHVATLHDLLLQACHGSPQAQAILSRLRHPNLSPIYDLLPALPPPKEPPIVDYTQLTFQDANSSWSRPGYPDVP